jgi:hypothetical protein
LVLVIWDLIIVQCSYIMKLKKERLPMKRKIIAVPVLALIFCCINADKTVKRPPMGWNSFDCFGPYVSMMASTGSFQIH